MNPVNASPKAHSTTLVDSEKQSHIDWRSNELTRLRSINAPLLAIGAGENRKAPADPDTGLALKGWQKASHTVEQIQDAHKNVIGAGMPTGNGLITFDVDGTSAVAWLLEQGCDPAKTDTWQIHRDTDSDRLKAVFEVSDDQQRQIGEITTKIPTQPPIGDKKGEAVELFNQPSSQVIVIGEHPTSGGNYYWPEGKGPEALAPLPECWFKAALLIIGVQKDAKNSNTRERRKRTTHKGDWRPLSDCPICGRNTTGYCAEHRDGKTIRCFHGNTFAPPTGLKAGETINDRHSKKWAFSKEQRQANGHVFSIFVEDDPTKKTNKTADKTARKAEPNTNEVKVIGQKEIKERLEHAIREGISDTDLEFLIQELSSDSDRHHVHIAKLASSIRADYRQELNIEAEARQLTADKDNQEITKEIDLNHFFPRDIAEAINTKIKYLPCKGISAAIPFMTAVAGLTALGTKIEGCEAAGYVVPINLYSCLVSGSGAKKSPVGKLLVTEPLFKAKAQNSQRNNAAMEAWEEANKGVKHADKTPKPNLTRVDVSDFTVEALGDLLSVHQDQQRGLLIKRDELSALFASLNQYKGGKGSDEQSILEMFDGTGQTSIRVIGNRHYTKCQVSIYGNTQTETLRHLVSKGDASGLWARFLFVPLPRNTIKLPLKVSKKEINAVNKSQAKLIDICEKVYNLDPRTYKLSSEASKCFVEYEYKRQDLAQKADIGAQSAVYGKSAAKVLRVAGVLHILNFVSTETKTDAYDHVSIETMNNAITIVDLLDSWALSLHQAAAEGGIGEFMKVVHKAAEAAGEPIKWSDLSRKLNAKSRNGFNAKSFAQAAKALETAGYGTLTLGARGGGIYKATNHLP
jgi:hypothetical protein